MCCLKYNHLNIFYFYILITKRTLKTVPINYIVIDYTIKQKHNILDGVDWYNVNNIHYLTLCVWIKFIRYGIKFLNPNTRIYMDFNNGEYIILYTKHKPNNFYDKW